MKLSILLSFVSVSLFAQGNVQIIPINGGLNSNDVYTIIQAVSPTNSGITSAQAATLINDTNVNRIQPVSTASINVSSNSVFTNMVASVNITSNSVYTNAVASINISSNSVYTNTLTAINISSNSVWTNLPPRGNYLAFTNSTTGLARQVPLSRAGLDTNGSPVATWTNLVLSDLEFHVNTNAFTNVVVGTLGPLTNKDGFVFYIPFGTNMP